MSRISPTEKVSPGPTPQLARSSAEAIEQLGAIFSAYNDTTDRMRESHRQLHREVARLREELEHKNEQLQRKNRLAALGEMAAGIAHEFRNPLGAVQLYASLLERDLSGQDEPVQLAQKISKRAEIFIEGGFLFAIRKVPILIQNRP